jgi:CubicO group peptidase (beta-lactamase class C family)
VAVVDSGALEHSASRLADAVRSYVREGQIVGAELLVLQGGAVLLHEAFGLRNRENGDPMEPGTIFNIRSMTKTMVGAVVQMLVDEGRLSLDDHVADYLPGFAHGDAREITVDQLLSHRAGLPLSVVTSLTQYDDLVAMGNAIGERGPEFGPGTRFWYSDAGANALGAVVEVVEGRPLGEVLTERLLEPLGMNDSFVEMSSDDPRWARVASLYAKVGEAWILAWSPHGASLYPFGWGSQGVYATPADYAKFTVLLLHGGCYGDRRLLSERAVRSMLQPVSRLTALGSDFPQPTHFSGLEARYGRMVEVHAAPGDSARAVIVGHSGSDGTVIWAWPDRDLVVAYFTQSRGNVTYLRMERVIDDVLLHPNRPAAAVEAGAQELEGSYVANFGRFRNARMRVVLQDGVLALDVPGIYVTEIGPPNSAGWRALELIPGVFVTFEVGDDGTVRAMVWKDGERSFHLPKVGAGSPDVSPNPAVLSTVRRP